MNSERELFKQAYLNLRTADSIPFPDAVFDEFLKLRQGYKLVLLDHMSVIRDALVIACDSGKNYQRYEDSLNYVHKAMIGSVDE